MLAVEYKKEEKKLCIFQYFMSSARNVIFTLPHLLLVTVQERETHIPEFITFCILNPVRKTEVHKS